jgi:hypothetical protein
MVFGSLLLSLLLVVFVKMPWHGPEVKDDDENDDDDAR